MATKNVFSVEGAGVTRIDLVVECVGCLVDVANDVWLAKVGFRKSQWVSEWPGAGAQNPQRSLAVGVWIVRSSKVHC